jgi:hypothetical protein
MSGAVHNLSRANKYGGARAALPSPWCPARKISSLKQSNQSPTSTALDISPLHWIYTKQCRTITSLVTIEKIIQLSLCPDVSPFDSIFCPSKLIILPIFFFVLFF